MKSDASSSENCSFVSSCMLMHSSERNRILCSSWMLLVSIDAQREKTAVFEEKRVGKTMKRSLHKESLSHSQFHPFEEMRSEFSDELFDVVLGQAFKSDTLTGNTGHVGKFKRPGSCFFGRAVS